MMTPDEIRAAKELAEKATAGPWCAESCGEKGDGANMIGVAFGPDDDKCERPLSGWLKPFDDDGNEIEYYRDEEVAVCEHHNRNSGYDAQFIAASRTLVPALCDTAETLYATLSAKDGEIARLLAVVEAACEWHRREYNGASAQRVNEAQLEFVRALSALQEGEKS